MFDVHRLKHVIGIQTMERRPGRVAGRMDRRLVDVMQVQRWSIETVRPVIGDHDAGPRGDVKNKLLAIIDDCLAAGRGTERACAARG
jgi:hypothetical protein